LPVSGLRRRTIWMAWAAAWGKGQPGGDGGDFQDAPFVPPVAAGQIN